MQQQLNDFITHVREISANPAFMHHQWFVTWHIELVERLSLELTSHYPYANTDMVRLLAWAHDYGKIIDRDNEHAATLTTLSPTLRNLGFNETIVATMTEWLRIFDSASHHDITTAPIEVQIVSSADGCSHLIGPFMQIFWQEFADRSFEELMAGNLRKARKDWAHKVVLPEAHAAFAARYQFVLEQNGQLPDVFVP